MQQPSGSRLSDAVLVQHTPLIQQRVSPQLPLQPPQQLLRSLRRWFLGTTRILPYLSMVWLNSLVVAVYQCP
jgi:hypothetical protein